MGESNEENVGFRFVGAKAGIPINIPIVSTPHKTCVSLTFYSCKAALFATYYKIGELLMSTLLRFTILCMVSTIFNVGYAQLSLSTSPYQQDFNAISGGLPTGWDVRTGATASSLGTAGTYVATATAWNSTTGNFRNAASATGLTSSSLTTDQAASTNRALAIRQTGSFGDPGGAFNLQIQNTTGKTGFKLTFLLQSLDVSSPRSVNWTVQFGTGAAPTSFTTASSITGTVSTGGSTFTSTTITADFGSQLDNISNTVWIRILPAGASTGSGNRPTTGIDDINLSWSSGATPTISVNPASLAFGLVNIGSTGASQYTVSASNLGDNLNVSVTAPFAISSDNSTFGASLSYTPAQMASNQTVYVHFTPTGAGAQSLSILHSSTGAADRNLALTGEGLDPMAPAFNFNTCTLAGEPGSGFIQYSVTGAQLWNCTSFGRNTTNGVQMNGYSGGNVDNEDWLISPALNLSTGFNIPVLRFWSRTEFSGPAIQVLASTNYSGIGNPNAATWSVLPVNLPGQATNSWTLSDNIDLSAFKTGNVYIAFKYTSSVANGAARWTLDDVSIANMSQLLSLTPSTLTFGEQSVGTNSPAQTVQVLAKSLGDLTLSVANGWQLSTDNTTFTNSISIPSATAATGTSIYARYSPVAKALRDTGRIRMQATAIDSTVVWMFGSSYPHSETLDIACWNMMFFGSNSNNNATQPFKEQQKQNAKTVITHLNADLLGVEEVSSDSLMNVLVSEMPGYNVVLSPRWSYSFDPPDPNFPPQKTGFIYNSNTLILVSTRPMFEAIYDAARGGANTLPGYPTASGGSSFWASGRLPFMATFTTNINGVNKTIRAVVIHGKSGGSNVEDYNRRVYDAQVLKDSLDAYYSGDNVIIVGDYNDDVITSIFNSQVSPYKIFINDAGNYSGLTAGFTTAGKVSFVGSSASMIDHHVASNELNALYLATSADVEDARNYVTNYTSTTSDHLPVYSRYALEQVLPAVMLPLQGWLQGATATLSWETLTETNTSHFEIERSADGRSFEKVGTVASNGGSQVRQNYSWKQEGLQAGTYYYRLRQVDKDGKYLLSRVVTLRLNTLGVVTIYPNPVANNISISLPAGMNQAHWKLSTTDGRVMASGNGSAENMVRSLQAKVPALHSGWYLLQVNQQTIKLVKE